jgi:hypothetical protein
MTGSMKNAILDLKFQVPHLLYSHLPRLLQSIVKPLTVEKQYAQSHFTIITSGEHPMAKCTDALCSALVENEHRTSVAAAENTTENVDNNPNTTNLWPENVTFLDGSSAAYYATPVRHKTSC